MPKLPEKYASLEEQWDEWILATEPERTILRFSKTSEELSAFYDALKPIIPDMIEFLNGYSIDSFPPGVKNLWWLMSSYIGVAVAIEIYGSVQNIPGAHLFVNANAVQTNNALELLR